MVFKVQEIINKLHNIGLEPAPDNLFQSLLRIPALTNGIIVKERAIEWNFVCDYATSYEVTDETNMAPAPTTLTPPTDNASRNSDGFHSNGFYDVKLRKVSTALYHWVLKDFQN